MNKKVTIIAKEASKHMFRCEACMLSDWSRKECSDFTEDMKWLGLPDCDDGYYYIKEVDNE